MPRSSMLVLFGIGLAFLIVRVPIMYRQQAAQDEDYFAVPGWTILTDGVPRIPYLPSRNPEGAFYKADVALFALPPGYFYWQAAFYSALGPSTGTARLASGVAGLGGILLIYLLGRELLNDERKALWGAGLYSVSRVLYFPTLFARPDMLCGALGLGALLAACVWHRTQRRRALLTAGGLLGLGALAHPFAMIYAVQVGGWVLIASRSWRSRLTNAALLVGTSVAVFAAWLPLILAYPDLFRSQFFNNVLGQAGPGIGERLLLPWSLVTRHAERFWEHAGAWQAVLMTAGLLAATAIAFRHDATGRKAVVLLTWSAIYLLVALQGMHPTKGYWCYPGGLMFLCTADAAIVLFERLRVRFPWPRLMPWAGGLLLMGVMLPGAGLRTWIAHVRHWNDVNYDSRRFTQRLLAETPAEGTYLVGPAYVFDFYLAGRETVLALDFPFFFEVRDVRYDYLIADPSAIRDRVPEAVDAEFLRAFGDPDDLFACYARFYQAPKP